MNRRISFIGILFLLTVCGASAQKTTKVTTAAAPVGKVWTAEKANAWYAQHPWLTGANYIPQTAINQLEMWQGGTFGPAPFEKELGWGRCIWFYMLRGFL